MLKYIKTPVTPDQDATKKNGLDDVLNKLNRNTTDPKSIARIYDQTHPNEKESLYERYMYNMEHHYTWFNKWTMDKTNPIAVEYGIPRIYRRNITPRATRTENLRFLAGLRYKKFIFLLLTINELSSDKDSYEFWNDIHNNLKYSEYMFPTGNLYYFILQLELMNIYNPHTKESRSVDLDSIKEVIRVIELEMSMKRENPEVVKDIISVMSSITFRDSLIFGTESREALDILGFSSGFRTSEGLIDPPERFNAKLGFIDKLDESGVGNVIPLKVTSIKNTSSTFDLGILISKYLFSSIAMESDDMRYDKWRIYQPSVFNLGLGVGAVHTFVWKKSPDNESIHTISGRIAGIIVSKLPSFSDYRDELLAKPKEYFLIEDTDDKLRKRFFDHVIKFIKLTYPVRREYFETIDQYK